MLIRSQDKKRIFDMTGSNIEIGKESQICGFGNTCTPDDISTVLGRYKTEERAIEILDEICSHYKSNENRVFQMPEV